jgi:hypothetical protein
LRVPDELEDDVRNFHKRVKLEGVVDVELLIRGARIAQDLENFENVPNITLAEKKAIMDERKGGFLQQSKDLKVTILTTACAAITQ